MAQNNPGPTAFGHRPLQGPTSHRFFSVSMEYPVDHPSSESGKGKNNIYVTSRSLSKDRLLSLVATATVPDNLSREQSVYMVKLAGQAEHYENMVKFMEKIVVGTSAAAELTIEERNLLSIAYKNVIGSLRAAWRIVSSIEQKEESLKKEDHVILVNDYRSKVKDELSDVCSRILKTLESNLVSSASTSESTVFYLKMKGDYRRYLAEFKGRDERKETAEGTTKSYKAAQDIALGDLPPTHPIRLGLALNFSMFYSMLLIAPL